MSEATFFHINNANDQHSVFRGLVRWFKERYAVKILDETSAFEGEVTVDITSECCQSLNISMKEYIEECKTAFKINSESSAYSFSIDNECLNIRKVYEAQSGSTFKVIFSSVPLKMIDYSSAVIEILDSALTCNRNYSQTIDTLSQKTASLLTDYQKMMMRLEEMEKDKLQFENIIYHKFVNLLNSKKEFWNKQRTPAEKEESDEFLHLPYARNVIREAPFDAETDSDEADNPSSYQKDQPSTSAIPTVKSKKSPKSPNFASNFNSQSSFTVESVLNSLPFLDPSVSFLNK